MFWWESRLIVSAQLFALAGWQGASDVIYICGCDDITKLDVSGWIGKSENPGKAGFELKGVGGFNLPVPLLGDVLLCLEWSAPHLMWEKEKGEKEKKWNKEEKKKREEKKEERKIVITEYGFFAGDLVKTFVGVNYVPPCTYYFYYYYYYYI